MTEQPTYFFMAALLAFYEREGVMKQRHINILMEAPQPQLMKRDLAKIHGAGVSRLRIENAVEAHEIKDIVILNIFLLAAADPAVFHAEAEIADSPTSEAS